jgi:hypothetical protein
MLGSNPGQLLGTGDGGLNLQGTDPHFLGGWISKAFRNCLFSASVLNYINPKNPLSRRKYKNIYFPLYTLRKNCMTI